jgi:predicted membrane GTPase involved in stress response
MHFGFLTLMLWTSFVLRSEGTTLLKYKIPTRGLLGLRNAILTASRGTAILNTIFDSYGPWAGDIITRDQGSLVITNFQDCLEIRLLNINYSLYFG